MVSAARTPVRCRVFRPHQVCLPLYLTSQIDTTQAGTLWVQVRVRRKAAGQDAQLLCTEVHDAGSEGQVAFVLEGYVTLTLEGMQRLPMLGSCCSPELHNCQHMSSSCSAWRPWCHSWCAVCDASPPHNHHQPPDT